MEINKLKHYLKRWYLNGNLFIRMKETFFPKMPGQFLVEIYDIFYKYFKSETLKAKNMRTLDVLVNPFYK